MRSPRTTPESSPCPPQLEKACEQEQTFAVTTETEQDTVGVLAPDPFYVPCFLFVGNRLQPSWPSLRSKRQVQTVANQGREGTQRQRRSSQETVMQETPLAVQWLGFLTSNAGGMGSIPDRGTKTPHATETAQPWDRVLVPPQRIHVTISLSSSAELKPPTNVKC